MAQYINTLREVVDLLDTSRPFASSSPSNGLETEQEGWVAKNPQDPHFGDIHLYLYSAPDLWDPQTYTKGRFVSEFGFQSMANLLTWSYVSNASTDWNVSGDFLAHRQHKANGTQVVLAALQQKFLQPTGFPSAILSRVLNFSQQNFTETQQFFAAFIYLSQVNQAEVLRAEIEFYRSSANCQFDLDGKGMTMGALYWQLNDIWPTVSWSTIDFAGTRKYSHYMIQRVYQPETLVPIVYNVTDTLRVFYVNDQIPIGRGAADPCGLHPPSHSRARLRHSSLTKQSTTEGNRTLQITCFSYTNFTARARWLQQIPLAKLRAVRSSVLFACSHSE